MDVWRKIQRGFLSWAVCFFCGILHLEAVASMFIHYQHGTKTNKHSFMMA